MIREVKIRPLSDDREYQFKYDAVVRFLGENYQVKITVMFRGREVTHPEMGRRLLERFAKDLESLANPESQAVMDGTKMIQVFTPKAGS